MTSGSLHSNSAYRQPFLLKPVGKDYLWGGDRLNTEFGKGIAMSPLAETWECSTHPDGVSKIASGEFSGLELTELINMHPEILGEKHQREKELPILIKFIDAKQNLSVQVHPSDEYAKEKENGQKGKSEMWYIVDASRDAKIVYGFNRKIDADTVKHGLYSEAIENYLNRVSVNKNEVYFIEAGTVHAIGAGALIVEVQENSNLTYRLYDYNRIDKSGKKRELHVDKALEVLNYENCVTPRQPMRILKFKRGCATEFLCSCEYFEVNRMLVNTEILRTNLDYQSDKASFRVLICIDGCGYLRYTNNQKVEIVDIYKGDTIFMPANSVVCGLHGKAQFLEVRC